MTLERQVLEPSNPLPSFDARVWARSFMEHNAINPDIARDEETMVTWFANALMRGYDEHANAKQPNELKAPDLLAVIAAAKRFMHAHDTNPYEEVIERRTKALRSALAKVEEGK